MSQHLKLYTEIMRVLEARLGEQVSDFRFPPPVFAAMKGEFLGFDLEAGTLKVAFPVLTEQLNPYGTMQGGMIAAAIDNALGPLSMLLAPPNLTRKLEITYNRPATLEMEQVIVETRLVKRVNRLLHFKAVVTSPSGARLARAKAVHWVLDSNT